jgi:hypothetical protein
VNFNWNDCNWEFKISIYLKSGYLSFDLESTLKKELVIENVRAICWIVPKKYLLLLDQTILFQFRSSIDRPLNLPQYPGSNNYFSIPEEKYIINNWGLMKKNYFGWSGVYFIFILHLYITVTCRHTIVFYGKHCFSNIKTSSKRLEYLNIFPSFFKKCNTSCTKKYFNSICVLFILIIW